MRDCWAGEADVTLAQALRQAGRREPAAVVRDREGEVVVLGDEADPELRRLRVLDDVREQLAGRREDELLLRVPPGIAQVELEVQAPALGGASGERAERCLEPGLVEDVRMQVEDGVAELPHGLRQRLVRAAESRVRDRLGDLREQVADGEQILEGVVVERVGERLPLALLRLECVVEQLRPRFRELLDEPGPAGEHHREEDAGDPDPGEEPGLW